VREWGIEAWRWIVVGVLTGILSLMMLTGLGSRRGTRLNRLRLALWAIVIGLGGVSGTTTGCSDGGSVKCYSPDSEFVEEEDVADPDPAADVPVDGDEIEDSPRDMDDLDASGEEVDEDVEDEDLDGSDDA